MKLNIVILILFALKTKTEIDFIFTVLFVFLNNVWMFFSLLFVSDLFLYEWKRFFNSVY